MKFTDGVMLIRDNYEIFSPAIVYEHKVAKDKKSVELFAPYRDPGRDRFLTTDIGATTVKITSPQKNILGIKLTHWDYAKQEPNFEIDDKKKNLKVTESKKLLKVESGDLRVEIPLDHQEFEMKFFGGKDLLTTSEFEAQGEITDKQNKKHYMREVLDLDVGEVVYGLGERFTNFIKNGQVVDIFNKDGGTGSEQTYKNIPFYLTNRGYGVFVAEPDAVSFEVAAEFNDKVQFSVEGQELQYYIIYGPTPKDIIKRYTDLTGKPALPPAWSFGLWLSTSFVTDYSDKTVLHFIDEMQKNKIPLDVFHFDCFWMDAYTWVSFEWSKEFFKDAKKLLNEIHKRGIKVCVWINPYIAQKSKLYKEARDKGYLIKNAEGNPWQIDRWQPGTSFVDFTNPKAVKWYTSHLVKLMEMGVDTFKTDFGERIPVDGAYFYNGANSRRMHNYYTYLYNKAVFDTIKKVKGPKEALVFGRSTTAGSQKFPVQWGGDCYSRYPSMAASLRGGLSFLSSGFGFWSHDIGGFNDSCSPDLYKRWTQFGLLSSHSRYHGCSEYRVPWIFDKEAVKVTKKFVDLKVSLMPYLYEQAVQTHESGVSLMRPMFMEFDNDINCEPLATQYMLGPNLLVAPIFNDKSIGKYYLPKGKWTNLLSNKFYDVADGKWFEEKYDYFNMPLFVRENSIILMNPKATQAKYKYLEAPEIHLFQLENGFHKQNVVNENGIRSGAIKITKKNDQLTIDSSCLKKVPTVFVHTKNNVESYKLRNYKQKITIK